MEYQLVVTFKANRILSQTELANLQDAVALQVVEPADLDGLAEDYKTFDIEIKIDSLIESEGN